MLSVETGYLYELLRELGLSVFWADTVHFIIVRPLKILLIVVLALLVGRIGVRWIRRSVQSIRLRTPIVAGSARAEARAATIADVLASGVRVVVWSVATLIVFDELGVNLAPLLAGAGIAGVAIGFGAQSLVKDVISGLFILAEDQYGVGDLVELEGAVGTVEEVNLRVTRLRSVDGKVWFVPNGEIRRVANASLGWARAVVDVPVGHGTDVERAIEAIGDELEAMGSEAPWADVVAEPAEVWGVEAVGVEGVTVRVAVKTTPEAKAEVTRAVRARVESRLRREGVTPPGAPVFLATAGRAGAAGAPSRASRAGARGTGRVADR